MSAGGRELKDWGDWDAGIDWSRTLPSPDAARNDVWGQQGHRRVLLAVTAALLTLVSDLIAQRLSSRPGRRRIDWRRTLLLVLYGLCWTGCAATGGTRERQGGLRAAPRWVPAPSAAPNTSSLPPSGLRRPPRKQIFPPGRLGAADPLRSAKKVALDQLSFGPFSNVLLICYFAVVVERKPWVAAASRVTAAYPGTQRNALRVLFTNSVSLVWTVWLIMRTKRAMKLPLPPPRKLVPPVFPHLPVFKLPAGHTL
eukprot:scaffold13.g311.t1